MTEQERRAALLMNQIMLTWRPPFHAGGETKAEIAQTCAMQAIAYIMGRDFMPDRMSLNQRAAIDQGIALFEKELGSGE